MKDIFGISCIWNTKDAHFLLPSCLKILKKTISSWIPWLLGLHATSSSTAACYIVFTTDYFGDVLLIGKHIVCNINRSELLHGYKKRNASDCMGSMTRSHQAFYFSIRFYIKLSKSWNWNAVHVRFQLFAVFYSCTFQYLR